MTEISPITEGSYLPAVPKVTDRSYTVERVVKIGENEHKVSRMIYTVTTYDRNGILTTSTNSNKVDFLI